MRWGPAAVLAVVAAAVASLASGPPDSTTGEVTVTVRDLAVSADELEVWLARQNLLTGDSSLLAYLEGLVGRITATSNLEADRYRVRVLRSVEYNAHSFVNGVVYVCTAVLALMRSEAQLVMLLAHEIAHIRLDHHLQSRLEFHRAGGEMARTNVAGSFFLGVPGATAAVRMQRALCGFSRERESEADAAAVRMVQAAGYDALQAIELFTLLARQESEAKARTTDSLLRTHPELTQRFIDCRALLADQSMTDTAAPPDGADFRARMAGMAAMHARDLCVRGRFAPARAVIDSLRVVGAAWADTADLLLAGLYERRGGAQDLDSCDNLLSLLETRLPACQDRELQRGYLFLKRGMTDSARVRLERFCASATTSCDSAFAAWYLERLP